MKPPTNEAVRILQDLGDVGGSIARALGVSAAMVSHWRNGKNKPSEDNRRALWRVFGVPLEAWTTPPKPGGPLPRPQTQAAREAQTERKNARLEQRAGVSQPPPAAEPLPDLASVEFSPDPRTGCIELIRSLRVARSVGGVLPSERVKLAASETRALALLSKLDTEIELSEDKIVRHPKYQAMRRVIIEALVEFPDAGRAVLAALTKAESSGNKNKN